MPGSRLFLVAIATALTTVATAAAVAGARPTSTAESSLAGPSTAHVGETYIIAGSGFAPGSLVPLEIAEAGGCCIALNMVADAGGSFSYTGEVWAPGTYRVRAFAQRNGSGRWRVLSSWTFEAYP
jgi:hypothetical protein